MSYRTLGRVIMLVSAAIVAGAVLRLVWWVSKENRRAQEQEYSEACVSIGGKPFINSVRWACYIPGHYPLGQNK